MGHFDRTFRASSNGGGPLKPVVVGFSGKIGSGKSEVSSALASRLAWPRASFGDYLRSVARSQGLPESREVLQRLGESFVAGDIRQFCRNVISEAGWTPGHGLIVDGIRHAAAAATLREIVAPQQFLLVLVEVPDPIREDRLLQNGAERESLRKLELHSTELQISSDLPHMADLKIDGTQEPLNLVNEIIEYVREQMPLD